MTSIQKFEEQHARLQRWYARITETDRGRQHNLSSDYYQDEVYAFFLNCYHLKDWIKHDPTTGPAASAVEAWISATPELQVCADICNGLKHLRLTSNRSGENPQFGNRQFSVSLGTGEATIHVKYTIITNSGPIDAFDLATKCLDAWEKFIASNVP